MSRYWKEHRYLGLAAALMASLLIAPSCSVEQTEEGEMPEVDIDAEAGELPEYDVDVADVDVGTRTKTVDVPKVKVVVEEEEIEVPYIDVDWPDDKTERVEKQVTVQLETPNDGFDVSIEEIHIVDDEIWVLSRLRGTDEARGPEAMVSDTVVVKAPEMRVKHFVIGEAAETKSVRTDGDYEFIESRAELADELRDGRRIYTS